MRISERIVVGGFCFAGGCGVAGGWVLGLLGAPLWLVGVTIGMTVVLAVLFCRYFLLELAERAKNEMVNE